MSNPDQRRAWLFGAVALAGGVMVTLAFLELEGAKASAASATRNVDLCQQLARQIAQLNARPSRIAWRTQSSTELGRHIEEAAAAAEIPKAGLVRIDPQPARRIGESAYKEQPISLELRSVTVPQLARMLQTLQEAGGLETTALGLTTSRPTGGASPGPETWGAQVTLTNLVFAPTNKRSTSPKQH